MQIRNYAFTRANQNNQTKNQVASENAANGKVTLLSHTFSTQHNTGYIT